MILAKVCLGFTLGVSLGDVVQDCTAWPRGAGSASLAQQPQELPRFRAGTNLVRVDAYVSLQGQALTDLKVEDFQVFEDDKLQKIENFELVTARRADSAVGAHRSDDRARHASGRRRRRPCVHALPRRDARVAGRLVSRPEADHRSARSHDRSRRSHRRDDAADLAIVDHLRPPHVEHRADDHRQLDLGHTRPDRRSPRTPAEEALYSCYGADRVALHPCAFARSRRSMRSRGSSMHLDGLRPERKFVLIFTEGWPLYRPDQSSAEDHPCPRTGAPSVPIRAPGGLRPPGSPDFKAGTLQTMEACNRQAHEVEPTAITSSSSASCCSAPIARTSASIRSTRAG